MTRKSIFSKIIVAILAIVMVASFVGCKPKEEVKPKPGSKVESSVVLEKVLDGVYKLLDGAAGSDGKKINLDLTIGVNIDVKGTKIPADLRIAIYAEAGEKAEMLFKLTDGAKTLLGIYSKDDVAYIEDGLTNETVSTFKVDASSFSYSDYLDDLPKIVKDIFRIKTGVAGVFVTNKADVFAVQGKTVNENIIRNSGTSVNEEDANKYYAAKAESYKVYTISEDKDGKLQEAIEPVLVGSKWNGNSYKLRRNEKILVTGTTNIWEGSVSGTYIIEGDGTNGDLGKLYVSKVSDRTDYILTSGEATPLYFTDGKAFFQNLAGDLSSVLGIVGGLLNASTTAKEVNGAWGAGDYTLTLVTKQLSGISGMLNGLLADMTGPIKGVLDTLLPYVLGASLEDLIAASEAAAAGDESLLDAINFPTISISSSFDAAGMITSLGLAYSNDDPKTDAAIGLLIKNVVINTAKPAKSLVPDSIINAAKDPVVEVGVTMDVGTAGISNYFDLQGKLYVNPAKIAAKDIQAVVVATDKSGKAINLAGKYYYDTETNKEYLLFDLGYLYTVLGLTPTVDTVYSYEINFLADPKDDPIPTPTPNPEVSQVANVEVDDALIKKPGDILNAILGSLEKIVNMLPSLIDTSTSGQVGINIDGTAIMDLLFGMNILNGKNLELIPENEKVAGEKFTHRYEKIDKAWIIKMVKDNVAPGLESAAQEAKIKEIVKELTGLDYGTASLSDILFGKDKKGIYVEIVGKKPTREKNGINITLKIMIGNKLFGEATMTIQIKDATTITIPSTNIDIEKALANALGVNSSEQMLPGSETLLDEWNNVLLPAFYETLDAILNKDVA